MTKMTQAQPANNLTTLHEFLAGWLDDHTEDSRRMEQAALDYNDKVRPAERRPIIGFGFVRDSEGWPATRPGWA